MGYKGIDKEYQLNLIVDQIIGDMGDEFTYGQSKYSYNAIIDEETIKELAENLKESYPEDVSRNNWFPVRFAGNDFSKMTFRDIVDEVIDNGNWVGRYERYTYSESDRKEIIQRCTEMLKKRLNPYAKGYRVQYKIFNNGEVGFRYE